VLDQAGAESTAEGLASELGGPWTVGIVDETVERLTDLGVTGDGDGNAPVRPPRRIQYRAPMSLQVTLVHPDRLLSRAAPGLRALTGRAGTVITLVLVASGLPILVAALSSTSGPLYAPAAISTYALVLLALLITVAVHELAHGAVLAAHGGRPRRMGFMFFYLLPAFFCDVSDAWRLAPRDRIRVALAGIVAQCALGALAALASLPATGDLEQGLVYYALLCYVYGTVNLLPFIKLDGYVALTAGLDIPHLRRKAMTDFQATAARRVLGAAPQERALHEPWTVWFGAGCVIVPAIILAMAVAILGPALLPLGMIGAITALLLAALLAGLLVRALGLFMAGALRNGAGRVRTAGVLLALVLVLGAALAAVRVPRTLHGGYAIVHGTPALVLGLGASAADDLRPGVRVRIARSGLMTGPTLTTATVTGRARACEAPLGALVPVRDARDTLAARCLTLRLDVGAHAPAIGRATASAPDAPLATRIAEIYVAPALEGLGISR